VPFLFLRTDDAVPIPVPGPSWSGTIPAKPDFGSDYLRSKTIMRGPNRFDPLKFRGLTHVKFADQQLVA